MSEPLLTGAKCTLRPLKSSDVGEVYLGWLNDPTVTRYLGVGGGSPPATLESVRRYLDRFRVPAGESPEKATDFIFAIIDTASGRHIGNVTINRIDRHRGIADTGILIGDRAFWGKGYAFDVWSAVLPYAFDRLGLRKILAGAVEDHTASLTVLRRLGFRVEGVLRGEFLLEGTYRDVIRMGMFRSEFYRYATEAAGERAAAPSGSRPR